MRAVLACTLLLSGCSPQQDPSPFAQADGAVSARGIELDGRHLFPNLHFGFETDADPMPAWCSMARAHGGEHSLRLKRGEEWTPVLKRALGDVADTLNAVQAGAWLWSMDPDPRAALVVSIERRPGQAIAWFEKVLDAREHLPGEWVRIQAEFLMRDRELLPTDSVLIYFWNKGRRELYIDDMDVFFYSRGIPGRPWLAPEDMRVLFPHMQHATP